MDNNNNNTFIGMNIDNAKKLCEEQKLFYRFIKIDGVNFMATQDMQRNRYNFTVEKTKIVALSMG